MKQRSGADFTFIDYETAIAGAAAATGERILMAAEPELAELEPGKVIPPDRLEGTRLATETALAVAMTAPRNRASSRRP